MFSSEKFALPTLAGGKGSGGHQPFASRNLLQEGKGEERELGPRRIHVET